MAKKPKVKDDDPKKMHLVGVFWQTETRGAFEGRLVEGYAPHSDDVRRGTNQFTTWLAVERYWRRTAVVRGESAQGGR